MGSTSHQHPVALSCCKALIALCERDLPKRVGAGRCAPAGLRSPASIPRAHATLEVGHATLARFPRDGLGPSTSAGSPDTGTTPGSPASLADCAGAPALHHADVLHPLDGDEHPTLTAYLDRLLMRPSVAHRPGPPLPARFPLPGPADVSCKGHRSPPKANRNAQRLHERARG